MRKERKTGTWRALAVAIFVFGMMLIALPAGATEPCTVEQAVVDIGALHTATTDSISNPMVLKSLLPKLDEAALKLQETNPKFNDAIDKLEEYQGKLKTMVRQGKVEAATATSLIAQAEAIIDCLESLAKAH